MMPKLPDAIAAYFSSQTKHKSFALADCFDSDAVVHDEHAQYSGLAAISAWQLETMNKTPFTANPKTLIEKAGEFIVAVEISGGFPGSPVTLDHVFTLRNDHILTLRIG